MGSDPGAPTEGEARAVAELLGRRPDEIAAVKLPGPGRLGESILAAGRLPELDGFAAPEYLDVRWDGDEHRRLAARYDSPEGSLIVVSHETGPQIFYVLLTAAAAATTVTRGVTDLIKRVRKRRANLGAPPDVVNAEPIRFLFIEDGRVRTREVLPLKAADDDGA